MDNNTNANDVRLVGRPSKLPLLLLLAALAAGLLAYMMWKSMDESESLGDGMSATSTPEVRSQDDLADDATTIAGVYAVSAASELHNENFQLKGATVASVVSDRLFYVTEDGNSQRLLVHLDQDLDQGGAEGQVRVEAGQRVTVKGELKDRAQALIEADDDYTDAEAAAASGERVYLHATDIDWE